MIINILWSQVSTFLVSWAWYLWNPTNSTTSPIRVVYFEVVEHIVRNSILRASIIAIVSIIIFIYLSIGTFDNIWDIVNSSLSWRSWFSALSIYLGCLLVSVILLSNIFFIFNFEVLIIIVIMGWLMILWVSSCIIESRLRILT